MRGEEKKLTGGRSYKNMSLASCFTCGHRRLLVRDSRTDAAAAADDDDDGGGNKNRGPRSTNAKPSADHAVPDEIKDKLQAAAVGTGSSKLVFFGEIMDSPAPPFDLEDLLNSSAEVLGRGSFGATYKATLEMGMVLAVKRLKGLEMTVDEPEFARKVEATAAMDHPNLVVLRAFHCTLQEKLLLYDYMNMGSLSSLLHGKEGSGRPNLIWTTRLNIALTAARGIEHIHSVEPTICHGNVKSSNVLFHDDFDARISDHVLSQLVRPIPTGSNHSTGHRAPEVTDHYPWGVSQKADVYSFGILLIELVSGKEPVDMVSYQGVDLAKWIASIPRELWHVEAIDAELILEYVDGEEEMVSLLELAVDCCASCPDDRPTMSDVVARIGGIR